MTFKEGNIAGVEAVRLKKWTDDRGWLIETFRSDEVSETYFPKMGYTSHSFPETIRGPHEHKDQSDLFVFLGPGIFRIWLWDNRKDSSTYLFRQKLEGGEENPLQLLIPPGVVHAYQNISAYPGIVQNFPNQLYAGERKKSPVDEIRHEKDPHSVFIPF